MNNRKIAGFVAALFLGTVGPSAALAQATFKNYRCADGTQFIAGFFRYDSRAHLQLDGKAVTRPGLDRKTRSMLNLAMLTALKAPNEIKLHVKGALANGVSVEEIKEILLHATVYCGIPAGLEAFKAAHEVLKAEGALDKK